MASEDEIRRLESDLAAAAKLLHGKGSRGEIRYGEAYQRLVQAGARPQIRKKYRV
jgi:hypothetical protein